jgi:hypothetical protein
VTFDYLSYFEEMSDDPDETFVSFAKELASHYGSIVADDPEDWDKRSEFCDAIRAAAEALDIDGFSDIEPAEGGYANYKECCRKIQSFSIKFAIKRSARERGYSIQLGDETKDKLRHYVNSMRDIITKLEIDVSKRDALLRKLEILSAEIERGKTRLQVVGDFIVTASTVLGNSADKLAPLRKLIDSVARLLGNLRETQDRLPRHEEPKKIEPPQTDSTKGDDEVPF